MHRERLPGRKKRLQPAMSVGGNRAAAKDGTYHLLELT
jgi:hypothetical protein